MKLSELYEMLSYGELSNTAMAISGTGGIQEKDQPKIVAYANEALIRMHSSLILCERDVLIEMVEHITNYHFNKRFAVTQYDPNGVHYPYIRDLPEEPFKDDVIKVLAVYDSLGRKLVLNDIECNESLFTPQPRILQVPNPIAGQALSVHYQAAHPVLSVLDQETEIDIPPVLHGALTAFIAGKVYAHMNTQESTTKGAEHLSTYQTIIDSVQLSDTVNISTTQTNTRFQKNGWI